MPDDLDLRDFRNVARLFPLPGVVLLPHVVLPLHIFEPRYREMTRDALSGDRLVTIVQARPEPDPAVPGEPALEPFGCLGRIIRHERLADGRYNFLLLGKRRVRLVRELEAPTLYRQAEVELIEDVEPADPADPRREALASRFRAVAPVDPELERLLGRGLPLGVLSDLLAHALGLPPAVKQTLLAEPDVGRRGDLLIGLLDRLAGPDAATGPPRPFPPFSVN